jgi:transcription initiation factor IIE alpha subunit
MNITLENLATLDELTIKTILDEISKNPSIVLPWYMTKSEILEQIEGIGNIPFTEVKEIVENGLSDSVYDCLEHNVPEWLE